jgi:hypothetical protein
MPSRPAFWASSNPFIIAFSSLPNFGPYLSDNAPRVRVMRPIYALQHEMQASFAMHKNSGRGVVGARHFTES